MTTTKITISVFLFVLTSCSYVDNKNSKTSDNKNDTVNCNPAKTVEENISELHLTLANGYTGFCNIIISHDSTKYMYNLDFGDGVKKLQLNAATPKELWTSISMVSDLDLLKKIKSGNTNQDRDGTDTIFFIRTKDEQDYSFVNGRGKEFEGQKKLIAILIEQLDIYYNKTKTTSN